MVKVRKVKQISVFKKEEVKNWQIVLPSRYDTYEKLGAQELESILKLATNFSGKVVLEGEEDLNYLCVYIGKTKSLSKDYVVDFDKLGIDGYTIQSKNNKVYIAGIERGSYFGVYDFCEIIFSYHYYAKEEIKISKQDEYNFYEIDILEKPDIEARSLGFYDTFKLEKEGVTENTERLRLGRNNYSDWALSCHTYFQILPKERYFEAHKDWYSKDGANLCLSNEEMIKQFIINLKEILSNTKGSYVMLGQEDNFGFCECEKCKKRLEKYKTESALMMIFANKVAKEIGTWLKEVDKDRRLTLVTFAYNRTATPPTTLDNGKIEPISEEVIAEDNLAVMIVPFSCVYSQSYYSEENKKVKECFTGWSKVAKRIHIWTYCVNFDNYMINFNNLDILQTNYKILKEIGVEFIFDQGAHNSRTPCFDELRTYYMSNLLWDTEIDAKKVIDDFMTNYYKDIAPFMSYYLKSFLARCDLIEKVYGEGARSGGGNSSFWMLESYFPKWFLDSCMETFREARGVLEQLRVKEWDKYLLLRNRLEKQMLSIRYLLLNMYGGSYGEDLSTKINVFHADCKKFGIEKYNEGGANELPYNF